MNTATATASTRNVSVRLVNSMAMLTGECSGLDVGNRLSPVHLGHVGQPRPDLVSRTAPPLKMMPALTITPSNARNLTEAAVGFHTASRTRVRGLVLTSNMLGATLRCGT